MYSGSRARGRLVCAGNLVQCAKLGAGGHQECLSPRRPGRSLDFIPQAMMSHRGVGMKEHMPGEMSCRAMKVQGVGASSRSCPRDPCCPWSTAICLQGWLQKGLPPGPASPLAYLGAVPGLGHGHPSRRWQPAVWTYGAAAGPDTRSGRQPQHQGPCAAGE